MINDCGHDRINYDYLYHTHSSQVVGGGRVVCFVLLWWVSCSFVIDNCMRSGVWRWRWWM